jgi:hypothetical protein
MENKIYENIKMTFEIGNGYGCYCEIDDATRVESFSSSISIQSMKERRYLKVDDDDVADELHEDNCRKNKTNKQIWFIIGVYSITTLVIIVEYLVFCVAKR